MCRGDGQARYPKEPTSRLGLAILAKMQVPEREFPDLVCGTSFIHALAGNPKYTRDTFFLEWHNNTLVVVHLREKSWDTASVGHRYVELVFMYFEILNLKHKVKGLNRIRSSIFWIW